MRILIAEDNVTSRTILTEILNKWGYETVTAGDGTEAWDMLQRSDAPGLAIFDWNIQGLDGFEVCRRIRQACLSNPPYCIVITAKNEKDGIVRGLDAGANDCIAKPYDNSELRARINVGRRMMELQTELLEAKDALAHEAMHDHLTGALNRRAILKRLSKELNRAARRRSHLSIGLCDLDHFKQVNDMYGHHAGDKVLCGFVQTIQSSLRSYDLLGRYGGEEFLLMALDSTGSAEEGFYERLRARVADFRTTISLREVGITVSIGVAGMASGTTVDALLDAADAALYRAKAAGRNRVCYATAGSEDEQ